MPVARRRRCCPDRALEIGTALGYQAAVLAELVDVDETLNRLRRKLGATSRAQVFRIAVTLLDVVQAAREDGLRISLVDEDDHVKKELIFFG